MIPIRTRADFKTDAEWQLYCRLHWFESLRPSHRRSIIGMEPWMFYLLIGACLFSFFAPVIALWIHDLMK